MAEEATVSAMTADVETSQEPLGEPTPASEPQATEPQSKPPITDAAPVESATTSPKSARERLAEALKDPDLRREYDARLNSEAQRITNLRLRREKASRAAEDPVAAVELAQEIKQEIDTEDATRNAADAANAAADADLADLWQDPDWATEYNAIRTGPRSDEFHRRYAENRKGFVTWVDKEIHKAQVRREATEMAKSMTEAALLAKTNEIEQARPRIPAGSSATVMSDDDFLAAYADGRSHDHKRAKEIMARLR